MFYFTKRIYTRSELEVMREVEQLERRIERLETTVWRLEAEANYKKMSGNAEPIAAMPKEGM